MQGTVGYTLGTVAFWGKDMKTAQSPVFVLPVLLLAACAGASPAPTLDAFGCSNEEAIPVRNYMAFYSSAQLPTEGNVLEVAKEDQQAIENEAAAFDALPGCAKDDLALIHGIFQKEKTALEELLKDKTCAYNTSNPACRNLPFVLGASWNEGVDMLGKMVTMYGGG